MKIKMFEENNVSEAVDNQFLGLYDKMVFTNKELHSSTSFAKSQICQKIMIYLLRSATGIHSEVNMFRTL